LEVKLLEARFHKTLLLNRQSFAKQRIANEQVRELTAWTPRRVASKTTRIALRVWF